MRNLLFAAVAAVALTGSAKAQDVEQVQLPVDGCYQAFWLQDIGAAIGIDLPVGTVCGHGEVDNADGGSLVSPSAVGQPVEHAPPPDHCHPPE